jgi:hypothetical protein
VFIRHIANSYPDSNDFASRPADSDGHLQLMHLPGSLGKYALLGQLFASIIAGSTHPRHGIYADEICLEGCPRPWGAVEGI